MGFYINFCTNVMSGLTLLCADLRFGLSPASSPLQSPFRSSFSLLLDFLTSPLLIKVQSSAISRPFWTSSCLLSTSRSNPPLFLTPFGLPRISPPLQSPFCHSCSLLLDFFLPPLHFKVHSAALSHPFWTFSSLLRFKVQSSALSHSFWTSACLPSASRSNPPRSRSPQRKKGGLQSNPPVQFHYFHASHQPIPPSKAPAISATSESGTRTYLPSGTNHFPIGLSAPALTASTANFFPATQKNIIAASIAPSGQI